MNFLKNLLISSVFFFAIRTYGQDSKEDKRLLDSLIANDEFLQLLNALDADKSYLTISIGASNRLASVNNNAINALQGNSKTIFTPGISYVHKFGFGISATGYVLNDGESGGLQRVSVTPFYQHAGAGSFSYGLSYTRFFADADYNAVESPVQNDLYANVVYTKSFVEPGLSIGYSTGKYKEIDKITINIPRQGRTTFSDTAITSLKSISASGSASHRFLLYSNISKKTGLLFTPSLMINAGSNSFKVEHRNNFPGTVRGNGRRRLFRALSATSEGASEFELQSAGINFYFNYSIHKFSVQPQIYLDYYLPSTSEKRFTQLYNVTVEYSF